MWFFVNNSFFFPFHNYVASLPAVGSLLFACHLESQKGMERKGVETERRIYFCVTKGEFFFFFCFCFSWY